MPLLKQELELTDITTADNVTYSALQIHGGLITRDPNGSDRTDVTPTSMQLMDELRLKNDGDTFVCYLINTANAAEAITISGGTNVTVVNSGQTITQNEAALLIFRKAAGDAISLYIVGA